MPDALERDRDAVNRALKALTGLQVCIGLISEYLKKLQRKTNHYDLYFDQEDRFVGVCYKHNPDRCDLASSKGCFELSSNCEWCQKHLDALLECYQEADIALSALPARLTRELDALTKVPWVAAARRNCLDNILKWPGETNHQTSYASEKVLGSVEDLLAKAEKFDPVPTWDGYVELLKQYGHDLFSIRGLVIPHPDESGGPPPVVLNGPGKPVTVRGKEKKPVTNAQYDVLAVLLKAGKRGLTKDELAVQSCHGDAVRVLGRIAAIDGDWESVVGLPGIVGGGYRILDLD